LDVGLAVCGCAAQKKHLPAAIDQCIPQRLHIECAVYGVSRPRMCKLKIEESARGGARARTPESYARRCVARQRTPWIFVAGTRHVDRLIRHGSTLGERQQRMLR